MSIRNAGFALCILLSTGCSEASSPTPEGVRPPPAKAAIPDCKPSHAMDERGFALIVDALRRNGEVERANAFYGQIRALVEARLAQGDPAAPARAKPALDAFFSGAELEKRVVCVFTRYDRAQPEIEAWDAWSSDENMRGIHGRIVGFMSVIPSARGSIDGERRELLARVANATGFRGLFSVMLSAQRQADAIAQTVVDPTSSAVQDIALNERFVEPPDENAIIDDFLGPQLSGISDDDLRRYLSFAETREGRTYYETLIESYTYTRTDWYERLGALLKTNAKPAGSARDPAAAAPMVAEARRLLDKVGTRVVVAEARTLLLKAEPLDPENAEIKTLLGRIALSTMPPGMPYEDGQIRERFDRMHPAHPEGYAPAEAYLRKAIELDPENAEAYLYLGAIDFRLSRDDEAAKQYATVRRLDPKQASLPLFEADLAYESGQYAKAERIYRQILAAPEDRAFNHHFALGRLRLALMKQGREREFRAAAQEQLRRDPELWDFRLIHAERLMATDGTVEEVRRLLEPVPDQWLPEEKRRAMLRLQLLRVLEATPSAREESARRAFEYADAPIDVAETVCVARGRAQIAPAMIRASGIQDRFAQRLLACSMWKRDMAFFDAVAPFVQDINRPNEGIQGQLAICSAGPLMDAKVLEHLLKAKADPKVRCGDGKTLREFLGERATRVGAEEGFNATARAMLAILDKYDGGG